MPSSPPSRYFDLYIEIFENLTNLAGDATERMGQMSGERPANVLAAPS
jgi:hypothetical protein